MKETRSNFRVTPKLNSGDNKLSVFSIIFLPPAHASAPSTSFDIYASEVAF